MSGGSFDYFYSRAPGDIARIASDLEDMASRCANPGEWGGPTDVDRDELAAVGEYLGALAIKARGLGIALNRLEQVTHDIEWWQSGDTGPERVVESFKKVRRT